MAEGGWAKEEERGLKEWVNLASRSEHERRKRKLKMWRRDREREGEG